MLLKRGTLLSYAVIVGAVSGVYHFGFAGSAENLDTSLPLAGPGYVLGDPMDAYADFMMSGGVPPGSWQGFLRYWRAGPAALRPSSSSSGYSSLRSSSPSFRS